MAYICGASLATLPFFPSVSGSKSILSSISPPSVSPLSFKLKKSSFSSVRVIKRFQYQKRGPSPVRCSGQSGFLKTVLAVWNAGKSSVEFGMKLVPDAVPRPIARISVTVLAVSLALFVLKSLISTLFFAVAVMALSYAAFLSLNKDQGSKGNGGETTSTSVEDSLEEARRIMEKYK